MAITLDRERINQLIAEQTELLNNNTQKSRELYEHASQHLSGGVATARLVRSPCRPSETWIRSREP